MRRFTVWKNGGPIGEAAVTREGMMLLIRCRCSIDEQSIPQLELVSEGERKNIGRCRREGGWLVLTKRISAKGIDMESLRFELTEQTVESIITKLKKAYYDPANGKICFRSAAEAEG